MRSLRPTFAPLLATLLAAAPTLAWADDGQPGQPSTGPDGATRPWIDETAPARPSGSEGTPARPATGEGPARPATGEAGETAPPPGDEGRRPPPAEGRGPARSPAPAGERGRAAAGAGETIGFSAAAGEHMTAEAAAEASARRAKARFGHKGHLVVDNVVGFRTGGASLGGGILLGSLGGIYFAGLLTAATESTEANGYKVKYSSVGVRPSGDYFLANGFSIGGSLTVAYAHSKYEPTSFETDTPQALYSTNQRTYDVGLEPRVGVALPLTDALSLWPRVGVGYHAYATGEGSGILSRIDSFTAFTRLGLVVNAGRHLFFDVGPELRITHASSDPQWPPLYKSTSATASVNGSLGLAF